MTSIGFIKYHVPCLGWWEGEYIKNVVRKSTKTSYSCSYKTVNLQLPFLMWKEISLSNSKCKLTYSHAEEGQMLLQVTDAILNCPSSRHNTSSFIKKCHLFLPPEWTKKFEFLVWKTLTPSQIWIYPPSKLLALEKKRKHWKTLGGAETFVLRFYYKNIFANIQNFGWKMLILKHLCNNLITANIHRCYKIHTILKMLMMQYLHLLT